MSAAELKELKCEVKKMIDKADDRAVKKIYALLEKDADAAWWAAMPDNVKADLETSIAQADKGEVMAHEEVKKKYPQWFTK